MIFLFSNDSSRRKHLQLWNSKKTTYSSAKASSQQHGVQRNSTLDEEFPWNSKSSKMKVVPMVKSKAVWMICNSLGIPANLDNDSGIRSFKIKYNMNADNFKVM
ncbi:hypothetical protein CEXT_340001 [Caerostris extrusa]|uniref:Uncharacterized protein n=1 Tax=Caerostris extrusa TaxID=172846 RepID=A0AAV4Q883_CAEEX|nr:hypothetical protein CEXT_340001 [Caerostris extrusa]